MSSSKLFTIEEVAELLKRIEQQSRLIAELQAEIARLKANVNNSYSSNSSIVESLSANVGKPDSTRIEQAVDLIIKQGQRLHYLQRG